MNKRSTKKIDSNGIEIFEGDKIIHAWGWFRKNGNGEVVWHYKVHTIVCDKARLMGDGTMHEDYDGLVFYMGNSRNIWAGNQVKVISNEEFNEIGLPEETSFFRDENGRVIKYTDQHFLGMNDEQWSEELKRRRQVEYNFLYGKTNG